MGSAAVPVIPALDRTAAIDEDASGIIGALVATVVGISSDISDSTALVARVVPDPRASEMTEARSGVVVGKAFWVEPLPVSSAATDDATSEDTTVFPRIEDARDVTTDPRSTDVGFGRSVADGIATEVRSPPAFAMLVSSAAIDDATSEGRAVFPRIDEARDVTSDPGIPEDAESGKSVAGSVASDVMRPPMLVRSAAIDDATSDGTAVFPRIDEAKEVTSTLKPPVEVTGTPVAEAVASSVVTAPMVVSSAAMDDATSEGIAVFPRIADASEVTSDPKVPDVVSGRSVAVTDTPDAMLLISAAMDDATSDGTAVLPRRLLKNEPVAGRPIEASADKVAVAGPPVVPKNAEVSCEIKLLATDDTPESGPLTVVVTSGASVALIVVSAGKLPVIGTTVLVTPIAVSASSTGMVAVIPSPAVS